MKKLYTLLISIILINATLLGAIQKDIETFLDSKRETIEMLKDGSSAIHRDIAQAEISLSKQKKSLQENVDDFIGGDQDPAYKRIISSVRSFERDVLKYKQQSHLVDHYFAQIEILSTSNKSLEEFSILFEEYVSQIKKIFGDISNDSAERKFNKEEL